MYPLLGQALETTRPPTAPGRARTPWHPKTAPAYEVLNEIIQYEPTALFDDELLGRLATLGIEKGKPFAPDERMQSIFEQAAKLGVAMSPRHRVRDPRPRDPLLAEPAPGEDVHPQH